MPDTRHSKASVSSLASEVNVQGEFVTLPTLREMLQMQERMFKSFFDSIVTNVNTRLDSLTHSVAGLKARIASSEKKTGDLRTSLEFLQKDIDDLKPSLLKLQELDSAIEEIQDNLNHQEEQMEYLENQSRRNNNMLTIEDPGIHDSFSLLHLNIRSLQCTVSKLTDLFSNINFKFSLIGISETWLKRLPN